jgi:hypothetical protein
MPKFADIKFKAVVVGAIVDNAGTMLFMLLLAAALMSKGLSEDEVMNRMKSTSGLLLGLIVGLSCTVMGGYFAGRIAGRAEVLHGALVAAVGMVVALIFREGGVPVWFDIAGFVCMLPAGMTGGYLARKSLRVPERS